MNPTADLDDFARLIEALEPWLNQIVIIGGWAHRLHRMHPHAQPLDYPPLVTLDTDIALPLALPADGAAIRERMLDHGFTEDFVGTDHPPATHYHLGGRQSGFYAEFLTPLTGCDYDRRGNRKATADIGGITSQQLRYIDLLLYEPWSIRFHNNEVHADVQIANPASFLAQKVLIHDHRDRADRAKDILYMYDTLQTFGAQLAELRQLWKNAIPSLPARSAKTVGRASQRVFGQLSDDIRRAAEISGERGLPPDEMRAACHYGFREVFEFG